MQGAILILAGSTGIAAQTARLAGKRGARVLIATGESSTGWELAAEVGGECWVGDLSSPGSAESVLSQCMSRFGRVDALFNAAGLSGRRYGDGPVHEITDDGWDTAISQNLKATFLMCRAVAGQMMRQDPDENGLRGSILNVGSILAESPEPHRFALHAYAAAKGAVVSLSRSMAAFYAPHKIRVNVIAPGLVSTPAGQRAQSDPALSEFLRNKQPLTDGMVGADDVARAALFLLGRESCSITGEVVAVDGGWSVTGA